METKFKKSDKIKTLNWVVNREGIVLNPKDEDNDVVVQFKNQSFKQFFKEEELELIERPVDLSNHSHLVVNYDNLTETIEEAALKYAKSISKNETYQKYLINAFLEGVKHSQQSKQS